MVIAYKQVPNCYSKGKNTRFALGYVTNKTLVVFGVNPSTANDKNSDPTITRVISLAEKLGFDGWLMLNIYPVIETDPHNIPKNLRSAAKMKNEGEIKKILSKLRQKRIVAAWGNNIEQQPFLIDCLASIIEKTKGLRLSWHSIGPLTGSGHPWHPLFVRKKKRYLKKMDIKKYIDDQQV